MKIYRGPHTSSSWQTTDSKKPSECVNSWQYGGRTIWFDGTIDKAGARHTQIGVRIEDDDVVALINALVKRYRKVTKEETRLREAMKKLYRLVAVCAEAAPSQEALLDAVRTIAEHYWLSSAKGNPKIDWIKWKSL